MIKKIKWDDLIEGDQKIILSAAKVSERAYNPYSGFFVGAAVRDKEGSIYCGTFFEVASFPEGVCAERVAIGAAISAGAKEIEAIGIVGGRTAGIEEPVVTPCGGCRQAIYELELIKGSSVKVICSNRAFSSILICEIKDLLPEPFPLKKRLADE